jgi:hypothetical protein
VSDPGLADQKKTPGLKTSKRGRHGEVFGGHKKPVVLRSRRGLSHAAVLPVADAYHGFVIFITILDSVLTECYQKSIRNVGKIPIRIKKLLKGNTYLFSISRSGAQ